MVFIVDCEWADWDIGECSKTCGGGKRINTRDKKVKAAHGGLDCQGAPTKKDICNVQACPGNISKIQTIRWNQGRKDGIGILCSKLEKTLKWIYLNNISTFCNPQTSSI